MFLPKNYIFLLFLILHIYFAGAQNITGTWEGSLGNDQYLQLNVIQVKNKLCGYTYDHVNANQKSYCKAYFTGHYDTKHKEWRFDGESFIENSGSHILMHIRLSAAIADGKTILIGSARTESLAESVFSGIFGSILGRPGSIDAREDINLQKISARPQQILSRMKDCYNDEQKLIDTVAKPPLIIKKHTDTLVQIIPPVIKHTDSVVKTTLPPVIKSDSLLIPKEMVKRKNIDEGHVIVHTKTISLNVYDNAIVDGDTVSIFFNGKLLLSHQGLSEKPIILTVDLDENNPRNELVLFAENLGSIPPNTALIVVYAGDKRYELFSKASLEENAVMIFEYKPK